jgi:hypothetical protein
MSTDAIKKYWFPVMFSILIGIISYCWIEIKTDIADISKRLRIVELQQVRICTKLGVDPIVTIDPATPDPEIAGAGIISTD